MHIAKPEPIPLVTGKNYTLYGVDPSGLTRRIELRIVSVIDPPELVSIAANRQHRRWRIGTYREPRKRTDRYLDVDPARTLIVPGTLHGVAADHQRWSAFAASATINLAAEPERIRELVNNNINPNFVGHDLLVAYPRPLDPARSDTGILVYPESTTTHAVVLQMRQALARKEAQ